MSETTESNSLNSGTLQAGTSGYARRAFSGFPAVLHDRDPWHVAAVAVPTLVALALAGYQLTLPSALFGIHSSATLGIEYDDGVYMGAAIRFVHGVLPYRDFDFIQPPGIVWLMSPVALLGRLLGTHDAMALARCVTALVVGMNAALAALVVRRRGPMAMMVAGLALASFPLAVTADHSLTLEPYLVCFSLIGAVLLFSKADLPGTRRIVVAGLAFGFAGSIKLWAILPIVAALICLLPRWGLAVRPFLKGSTLGFGISSIIFVIAAPHAFINDVVLVQINRSPDLVRGSLSIGQRLVKITGLGGLSRYDGATSLAIGITLGLLALAIVTYSLEFRRCTRADWFVLLAAVVVFPAMFVSPEFYDYYSYFPHVFLALLLGVCAAQIASMIRRLAQHDDTGRRHRLLLAATYAPTVAVVVLALVLIPSDVTYARAYLSGSIDDSATVDAAIPQGSCVIFDQPGLAIDANRFVPSASGCPPIVDPFGMWITRNGGNQPGSSEPILATFVAGWRSWLEQSNFLVLSVQFSDFIPWTPALTKWFNAHFVLISSQLHTFVYKNMGFTPPVAIPSDRANQLVAAGLAAERAGHVDQAFNNYKNAVAKDPSNMFALYDLGHIDQDRGDVAEAATEYRSALRVDPMFADALYNMGVLEAPVDPTSAINYYTQDLKVQPTNASANFNLGVLLIDRGMTAQGDSYLETGLRLNPSLSSDLPPGIHAPPTMTTPTG